MNDEIIGLIPAAGKGMRLALPYPKELYPVIRDSRYKPIAQFILESLTTMGLDHIVFVINETKHQLIGYFGDGHRFGCHISYVVQETSRQPNSSTSPGLANALDSAYYLTRGKQVCFGMADTIIQPHDVFAKMYEASTPDDDAILGLFTTERPEKFGMVRLDEKSRVLAIKDKPTETDLMDMWGCMIWRPRFTEHLHQCIHHRKMTDFAAIMNEAIGDGMRFRGVRMPDSTYADLGTYEEVMEMDARFRQRGKFELQINDQGIE